MIEVQAPQPYTQYKGKHSIFLAGSIDMGVAEDWQKKIVESMTSHDVLLLNPRRASWDSSWEQSIDNPQFREQVEWELAGLEYADTIIVYFAPGTKSPVTMLELGYHAAKHPEKLLVCSPKGFWRKGNIDIVCARYKVRQLETIDALIKAAIERAGSATPA